MKVQGIILTAIGNENTDCVVAVYSLASNAHVLDTQPHHGPQRLVGFDLHPLTYCNFNLLINTSLSKDTSYLFNSIRNYYSYF